MKKKYFLIVFAALGITFVLTYFFLNDFKNTTIKEVNSFSNSRNKSFNHSSNLAYKINIVKVSDGDLKWNEKTGMENFLEKYGLHIKSLIYKGNMRLPSSFNESDSDGMPSGLYWGYVNEILKYENFDIQPYLGHYVDIYMTSLNGMPNAAAVTLVYNKRIIGGYMIQNNNMKAFDGMDFIVIYKNDILSYIKDKNIFNYSNDFKNSMKDKSPYDLTVRFINDINSKSSDLKCIMSEDYLLKEYMLKNARNIQNISFLKTIPYILDIKTIEIKNIRKIQPKEGFESIDSMLQYNTDISDQQYYEVDCNIIFNDENAKYYKSKALNGDKISDTKLCIRLFKHFGFWQVNGVLIEHI